MESVLEILKYTVPAIVVLLTSAFLIRAFLNTDERKRAYELRIINQKAALPLRLQAYERLTLFLERISPHNIIHRTRRKGMTAQQFHLALIKDIRHEYEHNLSQQIYISPEAWHMVTSAKEEMITIFNRVAGTVPPEASEKEIIKRIFEYFMEEDRQLPTQKALLTLKKEVNKLL